MRSYAAFLIAAVTMLAFIPVALASSITNLRCENLANPLGIDVPKPRFSWIIESDRRNDMQSAYEVVVDGQWDSGRVVSSQSINVEYGGKELAPATCYAWKVRVWDALGNPSDWSEPATIQHWFEGVVGKVDR